MDWVKLYQHAYKLIKKKYTLMDTFAPIVVDLYCILNICGKIQAIYVDKNKLMFMMLEYDFFQHK